MMVKRSKKLQEADAFRAQVRALGNIERAGWTDWEADWLDSEARRSEDYVYSDNERIILNQLKASIASFDNYNDYSVADMLSIACAYIADLDLEDEEFVLELSARGATVLMVRQIERLARICRLSEPIGRDERVYAVLREIRRRDEEFYCEPSPDIAFV